MKSLSFGVDEKKLSRRDRAFYLNLRQRAIYTEPVNDQLRIYPGGTLAAHVLGFTAATDKLVEGHAVTELVGKDGIEAAFNSALNGVTGWRQTEKDVGSQELVLFREEDIASRPGLNVALTLDASVQDMVESELAKGMERNAPVSISGIVVKSSNIGAAKVGIKLGEVRLHKYVRDFGFGDPTGITLPGEARGTVHPVRSWYKVSIAQISMGQGLTVTPLQMAMAVSAIANYGRLMRPMLVDHLEDEHKQEVFKYQPQAVRQVISEETVKLMVQAMKRVVLPGGTAPQAALEHYTVAGKTGTGQKPPYGSRKYF